MIRLLLLTLIGCAAFGQSRQDSMRARNAGLRLATPQQWAERARMLETWMQQDPAAAMAAALPADAASRLRVERPDAAQWLEEWGEWEGPAERLIHDDFASGSSRRILSLQLPDGASEVHLAESAPALQCGDSIRVNGLRLNGHIAAMSGEVTARAVGAVCSTTGDQKVAVILLNFPGSSLPSSINRTVYQSNLNGASNSVDGHWRESSYGLTSATGTVFGPFTLSQNYSCSSTNAIRTAGIAAADSSVDFTAYTRIVFVFPGACGGLGSVGCSPSSSPSRGSFNASFAWIGSDFGTPGELATCVLLHELGHGLGLDHAASADYGSEPLGPLGAAAVHDEYGDRFSLMGLCYGIGGSYLMGHYAAPHKRQLGWFGAPNFQQVESNATFTLAPYEQRVASPQALRIRRGAGNDKWLWVEYRQSIGYDASLSSYSTQALSGALIHYENPAEPSFDGYTRLLNFRAATNPGRFNQPALTPGQTWSDPYTELSLQVTSATSAGLTINVSYDTPCAALTPSAATYSSSAATGTVAISAPGDCSWTALSDDPWITLTGATSGLGNGTVDYSITPNSEVSPRIGTISIGRRGFTVTQNSVNSVPVPASVTPASGSVAAGVDQLFTAVFSDADGASTINVVGLWISPDSSQTNACFVEYRRSVNELRLYDNAGSGWSYTTIGVNTTLSNSQCQISAAASSATVAGTTLTLRLSIKFLSTFLGFRNIYGRATDTVGADSGPRTLGIVTVTTPVTLTFNSVPSGYQLSLGGSTYTTPATLSVPAGSSLAMDVPSPQGTGSTRMVFSGWSDGGAKAHTLTVPSAATTYTVNFALQYQASTGVSPAAAGTIAISPASSDGFYNAGTALQFTAIPASGYAFSGFSGGLTGTVNPQSLTLAGPVAVTANFGCGYSPSSTSATVNPLAGGGSLSVTIAGGCTLSAPVSNASWLTASATGSAINYSFQSNLTAASRSANLTFNGQTFTLLQTAGITAPAAGASLATASQTFIWAAAAGADSYWLDVGTAAGSGNLCASGQITLTTFSCAGLPASSSVYVQLYLHIAGGAWSAPLRYSYLTGANSAAAVTAPVPGTRLTASSTFSWSPNSAADAYWLDVGSIAGQGNICASGVLAVSPTSFTCNGIPASSGTIYVQLWTRIAGVWGTPQPYTYPAPATAGPTAAILSSPTPGSAFTSATVTFAWTAGSGVDQYWLDVGTAAGQGDLSSGAVTTASKTVSGLPTDGRTINVRLWSHQTGASWLAPFDYTFTASSTAGGETRATLLVPAGGSGTLSGNSLPFGWKAGTGADGYWLDVGPSQGNGAYSSGFQTSLSRLVSTLPCAGQPVWARLWTRVAGVYRTPIDYTFTAASGCPAVDPRATLASPAIGSTVASSSATFTWNAGTGASLYWLDVGTSLGAGNLSAGATASFGKTVTGLPTGGQPLYVRLWTNIGSVWQAPIDYVF